MGKYARAFRYIVRNPGAFLRDVYATMWKHSLMSYHQKQLYELDRARISHAEIEALRDRFRRDPAQLREHLIRRFSCRSYIDPGLVHTIYLSREYLSLRNFVA